MAARVMGKEWNEELIIERDRCMERYLFTIWKPVRSYSHGRPDAFWRVQRRKKKKKKGIKLQLDRDRKSSCSLTFRNFLQFFFVVDEVPFFSFAWHPCVTRPSPLQLVDVVRQKKLDPIGEKTKVKDLFSKFNKT